MCSAREVSTLAESAAMERSVDVAVSSKPERFDLPFTKRLEFESGESEKREKLHPGRRVYLSE